MAFLYDLIKAKVYPPHDPSTSFAGKNIIVTGANSGIGFDASLKFVRLGAATVILAVRSIDKGKKAQAALEMAVPDRAGTIQVWELDMKSYSSIQSFAKRVGAEMERIDIALLNAGVIYGDYRRSAEGWEETLQVNVLSTVLLAMLLIPTMQSKARGTKGLSGSTLPGEIPHLCIVSSGNYPFADLSAGKTALDQSQDVLASFNNPKTYPGAEPQYNISKLLTLYAVDELATRTIDPTTGAVTVIVNAVNPGATATSLAQNLDGLFLRLLAVVYLRLLARTSEQGSRSLVSAVALGENSQGSLWQHDKLTRSEDWLRTAEERQFQRRIWKEIVAELGDMVPELWRL